MRLKTFFFLSLIFTSNMILSQNAEPFILSDEWLAEIQTIAPAEPTVQTDSKKHILIFSLHTGFEHWTIPHTEAIIKLISEKSSTYQITTSKDISVFNKKSLKDFDAIVLNNTCSKPEHRNLFLDAFLQDTTLTEKHSHRLARKMESNLLNFVKKGKGLIVLHGGITMLNKSSEFSTMIGGSFDYHPKQQQIQINLVDSKHPLVNAFEGQSFSHIDEPYFFNNAYTDTNFRPLLSMNANEVIGKREGPKQNIQYLSWIKKYGNGRVFYCAPSHNPQSYRNPQLLQFLLDGIQYAAGDLKCDDSPLK